MQIDVLYWKTNEEARSGSLPVFLHYGGNDVEHYGVPGHEYPGLVKVCALLVSCDHAVHYRTVMYV